MPRRGGRTADIGSILDLLGDGGFRVGVICGAVAAFVAAVVALRDGGGPARHPWAGLAFAGASVAGLAQRSLAEGDLLAGLVVLALGAVLAERLPVGRSVSDLQRRAIEVALSLPGAVLVAWSADGRGPGWVPPALVAVVVVGGALLADVDRRAQLAPVPDTPGPLGLSATGLVPVLLAITVFGVWVTVPETEHVVVLAGVTLPVALLGWPRPLASLGPVGASLVTAVLAWTVAVDGAGRPGAVIGGFACLGVLAVEPATRWVLALRGPGADGAPGDPDGGGPAPAHVGDPDGEGADPGPDVRRPDVRRSLVVLTGLHVVVVAVCARVAGLETSAVTAFLLSVVVYAVAAVAVARTPVLGRARTDHRQG